MVVNYSVFCNAVVFVIPYMKYTYNINMEKLYCMITITVLCEFIIEKNCIAKEIESYLGCLRLVKIYNQQMMYFMCFRGQNYSQQMMYFPCFHR